MRRNRELHGTVGEQILLDPDHLVELRAALNGRT
jgi:hypothetical protein